MAFNCGNEPCILIFQASPGGNQTSSGLMTSPVDGMWVIVMVTLLLVAKVTSQTNGYNTRITNRFVLTTRRSGTTRFFTAVTTNRFGTTGFFNQLGTTRFQIRNTRMTTNPFFSTTFLTARPVGKYYFLSISLECFTMFPVLTYGSLPKLMVIIALISFLARCLGNVYNLLPKRGLPDHPLTPHPHPFSYAPEM